MNEFNKQIRLLYSKWSKLKPLKFIIVTTILSLILMIPIALVIDLLNVGEIEIGGLNTEKYSYLGLFVLVVIVAPLIETIVFQLFPIKLIQKLLNNRFNLFPILISSILFSLAHYVYSVWYSLLILPLGFLLAQTYLIFQKRKESSFWITTFVHGLRNLIGVIVILSERI